MNRDAEGPRYQLIHDWLWDAVGHWDLPKIPV